MNILGINSVYHDSAAALLVDGKLVVAVEEERFNRIKHGKLARRRQPASIPEQAIRFCLDYAGLTAGDIDQVAYSFDPQLRRTRFRAEWWADPRFEEIFLLRLGQVRGVADKLLGRPLRQGFHFVPHHLAHAASAYYPVRLRSRGHPRHRRHRRGGRLDPGEGRRHAISRSKHSTIRTRLASCGRSICGYLGFSTYDASKLMGLAAYGNPQVYRREFQ